MNHIQSTWDWLQPGLALIGALGISVTGITVAAYATFRVLSEKWLDARFAEQLETYKAEQAKQLERLRHKISSNLDRSRRLHDREFELLPSIWGKIVEAKLLGDGYISPFRQYSNVESMNKSTLSEFLKSTEFTEGEIREINISSNKQDTYIKIFNAYKFHDVTDKLRSAHADLRIFGVFIAPALREEMDLMLRLIHSAVVEHQINQEHDVQPRMKEGAEKLKNQGEPLYKRIEDAVSARLWDSTTMDI